jgi:hypothetical protein
MSEESAENGGLAHVTEIHKRLADGIERRSADIAIDDAERCNRPA